MKKVILLSVVMLFCWNIAGAQYVNVTFRCNAAAIPDTMGPNSLIQIRGTLVTAAGRTIDDNSTDTLAAGVILAWNGHSTMFLKNISGDYWEETFPVPAGSQISYKFFTNGSHDTVYSGADWEHRGWEASIEGPDYVYGSDRGLDLSTFAGTDTTLPLQFANGQISTAPQYFRPYTETDSIDVWFRVDMQAQEDFNTETQIVGVRGAASPGYLGDLSWNHTFYLKQERKHANTGASDYNGENFWSGRVRIPQDEVTAGQTIEYKFMIMNRSDPDDATPIKSEDIDNRSFIISANQPDTTLYWVWFENISPPQVEHNDRVSITFLVDMSKAIQNRGFNYGDTVEVRAGYFGTARAVVTISMKRQGITPFYKGSGQVYTTISQPIDYQYYSYKLGRDYREVYYNFNYKGDRTGEAERRQVINTASTMTVADTLFSHVESRRMPFFRNVSIVAQDVLVTYTCDLRPAYYQVLAGSVLEDIQGTVRVTDPDSVLTWGVAINGPATGSWSNDIGPDWGRHIMTLENKQMYDDGTHGDEVAGDSIFTIQFNYYKDSLDVVGQEFKFGIAGGDNEGGYGNNHIENIDDSQPTAAIRSQFGSIDPVFYSAWDFDNRLPASDIKGENLRVVTRYVLEQNYPNPFNPTTQIRFAVPEAGDVQLAIYNMLGQLVKKVTYDRLNVGVYSYFWDGKDYRGNNVASGIYLYELRADDKFRDIKKMVLMK